MLVSTPLSRRSQFLLLTLIPLYFMVAAFFFQTPGEIIAGMGRILQEPDFLITDYFVVGGIGAAFFNAGLLSLFTVGLIYFLGMEMDGHTITSLCLMFGFSLFGKNILNIWALLAGVWLYAKYHRTPFSRYVYVGLYSTSLSPIITQITQIPQLAVFPVPVRLLFAIAVGIAIGFVIPPLATHVHYAHKGYSLYNVGFACGIIATIVVSLFRSFNIEMEQRLIWHSGMRIQFLVLLSALFACMALGAVVMGGRDVFRQYRLLLKLPGVGGTDFLRDSTRCATVFNMAVNGLFSVLLVFLVGGELNGPVIGSIFTIIGFSATGKHVRNIFPIMLGVYLASLIKHWNLCDPSPMLAFLLSTTLAPIAGEFGIICGIIAGFLHSSVVLNTGILYGGMNLYNNGFAGGLIAIFMIPVIQSIRSRKARAKENLSL